MCQLILPALLVLYSIDCVSYVYNQRSESRILSPDWLPPNQEIFINKKVKYGNIDPIDMVAYLDQSENFLFEEVETQWNRKIDPFRRKIYNRTAEGREISETT